VRLQQVQGDTGLDDPAGFAVQSTSPTIDAPTRSGVRGRAGPQRRAGQSGPHRRHRPGGPQPGAIGASAQPQRLEKLTAGQPVTITWRNAGLPGTPPRCRPSSP